MTIDRYTKVVLTLLMVGVWALAAAIFVGPMPLHATGDEQDVNIERIGGYMVSGALPVEIEGTVVIEFEDEPVFTLED